MMILVVGIGYLFSVIIFVGADFLLEDYTPLQVKELDNEIVYKDYSLCSITADYRGIQVQVYKKIPFIPFLEYRLLRREYPELSLFKEEMISVDYNTTENTINLSRPYHGSNDIENWTDTLHLN